MLSDSQIFKLIFEFSLGYNFLYLHKGVISIN